LPLTSEHVDGVIAAAPFHFAVIGHYSTGEYAGDNTAEAVMADE
jgi:hypothetical protein